MKQQRPGYRLVVCCACSVRSQSKEGCLSHDRSSGVNLCLHCSRAKAVKPNVRHSKRCRVSESRAFTASLICCRSSTLRRSQTSWYMPRSWRLPYLEDSRLTCKPCPPANGAHLCAAFTPVLLSHRTAAQTHKVFKVLLIAGLPYGDTTSAHSRLWSVTS